MKNYLFGALLLLFFNSKLLAQAPAGWVVNENDFQYSMTFVGFINMDGKTLANANDVVAAFVEGDCRGVAKLTYVATEDRYYAYLTVFANTSGETIDFKIYDSQTDLIKYACKSATFVINQNKGNLFQPYCFACPALSPKAEILDISFKDVDSTLVNIQGFQILLYVNNDQDLSALNAIFKLSAGAEIFIGTIKQISGANTIDFSKPVDFQVRSQDQSVLNKYTVTVKSKEKVKPKPVTITCYKKDAVCYEGGTIKVVYDQGLDEVALQLNGVVIASQKNTNGIAIFNNISSGTYKVVVAENEKMIIIK